MKKTLAIMTVVALSGCAMAQQEVNSANIVGYTKITLTAKETLVAVNFDKIGEGAVANLTIQDAFPIQDGMKSGSSVGAADQIQVRAGGTYVTYFLASVGPAAGKWVAQSAPTVVSSAPLPAGSAAWYISLDASASTPVEINVAGQVGTDATRTRDIKAGLNLIANPYPVDYVVNDHNWGAMGATSGSSVGTADQIQVRVGGTYVTYFLASVGPAAGKWVAQSAPTVVAPVIIPAGKSVWYIAGNDFTWELERPFDIP